MPESAPAVAPFRIDDELKEFIESGVAVLLGAVDAEGHPRVAYGWGPRVHAGGDRLSVYIERARSPQLLSAGLRQIAVTFTDPVSVRSVQVKGQMLEVGEPNEAEETWIARQRDAMTVSCALIGDPPHMIRNLWMDDTIRIDLTVERAFDQTPGPNAGQPLVSSEARAGEVAG